jgi:hypothetical protein
MKVELPEDVFIYLSSWLPSLAEVGRLWEALCLSKRGIGAASGVWNLIARQRYALCDPSPTAFEDSVLRAGIRGDEAHGLTLIKALWVMRKCSRSGCLLKYRELENSEKACFYHPGKLRNSSLTCCRAQGFRFLGCRRGFHDGHLFSNVWAARPEREKEATTFPPITNSSSKSSQHPTAKPPATPDVSAVTSSLPLI